MVVGCAVLAACGSADRPGADESSTPAGPPSSRASLPSPSPTPTPEPREFTVAATGDVLLHERLWYQAENDAAKTGNRPMDFAPQLAEVKPMVAGADLGICHLETPLAPKGGPYEGYPLFSGPPQIVAGLKATGYDACTTASNHTFDQGAEGIDRTLKYLDAAGLAHAGSARTPAEARRPTLIDVETENGTVKVGLLSYTFGFNGLPYPDGDTWRSNEIDTEAILGAAAKARRAGAEFIIAAMHWGTEYVHDPDELQQDVAPKLIASPNIDLLLGHHAHVVQPLENVKGEWVVYGMGNLMAAHRTPGEPQNEGLLVRFTVTENLLTGTFEATAAEYAPLLQTDAYPVGVINVAAALDGRASKGTASADRLKLALDRTREIVRSRGAGADGLRLLAPTR